MAGIKMGHHATSILRIHDKQKLKMDDGPEQILVLIKAEAFVAVSICTLFAAIKCNEKVCMLNTKVSLVPQISGVHIT